MWWVKVNWERCLHLSAKCANTQSILDTPAQTTLFTLTNPLQDSRDYQTGLLWYRESSWTDKELAHIICCRCPAFVGSAASPWRYCHLRVFPALPLLFCSREPSEYAKTADNMSHSWPGWILMTLRDLHVLTVGLYATLLWAAASAQLIYCNCFSRLFIAFWGFTSILFPPILQLNSLKALTWIFWNAQNASAHFGRVYDVLELRPVFVQAEACNKLTQMDALLNKL